MSKIITDSKNYEDIAAAIREGGGEGQFKPSEMADAIRSIATGGKSDFEVYTGTWNSAEYLDGVKRSWHKYANPVSDNHIPIPYPETNKKQFIIEARASASYSLVEGTWIKDEKLLNHISSATGSSSQFMCLFCRFPAIKEVFVYISDNTGYAAPPRSGSAYNILGTIWQLLKSSNSVSVSPGTMSYDPTKVDAVYGTGADYLCRVLSHADKKYFILSANSTSAGYVLGTSSASGIFALDIDYTVIAY